MKKSRLEFALAQDESVVSGVRRIATEELEYATDRLSGSLESEARDECVHEARKTIKRLRGLIRLVRDELGKDCYRVENDCLREAACRLAPAREAAAAGEALDALLLRFSSEQNASELGTARDRMGALQERAIAASLDREAIEQVVGWLGQVRARVADWPLAQDGWGAIVGGLCRIYAQGRGEFEIARANPTVEHLHEWRKRVKYHWFHIRLLLQSWPGPLGALRDELKVLSDLLGDDHDLSELALLLLREAGDPPMIDAELARLLGLIERRRRELVAEAFAVGARIYAERPQRLVDRLGSYFGAWRSNSASQ